MKIAVIADMHVGSIYGIAPRDKAKNPFQKWIIGEWDNITSQLGGQLDYVILNGDMVDGNSNKDTTTLWETDVDNQVNYAIELLTPLISNNTKILGTSGSGYHRGKGTGFDADRQITERLGGEHNKNYILLKLPNKNIIFRHTSKNPNTEIRTMHERAYEGLTKIDLLVGNHLHRYVDLQKGNARTVHAPCLQYPTQFMGLGESLSFGILIIDVNEYGLSPYKIEFTLPQEVEEAMMGVTSISEKELKQREDAEVKALAKRLKVRESVVREIKKETSSIIPKNNSLPIKEKTMGYIDPNKHKTHTNK